MVAVTGGKPKERRIGNVISVPLPTTAFIVPAPTPASRIATTSKTLKVLSDQDRPVSPRKHNPTARRASPFLGH